MLRIRTLMLIGLFGLAPFSAHVLAQSLEDELSILDDLPEADLSESSGVQTAQAPDTSFTETDSGAAADEQVVNDELALDDVIDDAPLEAEAQLAELPPSVAPVPLADTPAPPSALTGIEGESIAHLTALDFQQLPDRVRLRIRTDRGIDYQIADRPDRRQVMLEIQNASIANKVLKRALDTGEFDGPVALIKAFESKAGAIPSVKVLFQLRNFDHAQVTRAGTDLLVDFPIQGQNGKLFDVASDAPILPETILSSFDKMNFTGARMNLRVKDAPLADVLALISRASGQDFIMASKTEAKVTTQMSDAPWDQVLAMILLNSNMGYQKIGKTYRISPADELRKELDSAVESDKKKRELAIIETRIFPINYAKATELDKIVKNFLTPVRGTSSIEDRTNSIVVSDVRNVLDRVQNYIKAVDLQTPQILIEARVVQVTDVVRKNLDVRWNLGGSQTYINLGETGLGTMDAPGTRVVPPSAGLRISTSLPGIDAITAWLNMYETQDQTKVIASPKVTVLNNESAKIYDGNEFAIAQPAVADTATTYLYKEALLSLTVTPSVTSDGYVMMAVELVKDDIIDATGAISKKGAKTSMMVESGKTAVIGGVFVDINNDTERRMSYLGSLPILGRLFTPFDEKRREQRELLMFISPRILNADKATMMSTGPSTGGTEASF